MENKIIVNQLNEILARQHYVTRYKSGGDVTEDVEYVNDVSNDGVNTSKHFYSAAEIEDGNVMFVLVPDFDTLVGMYTETQDTDNTDTVTGVTVESEGVVEEEETVTEQRHAVPVPSTWDGFIQQVQRFREELVSKDCNKRLSYSFSATGYPMTGDMQYVCEISLDYDNKVKSNYPYSAEQEVWRRQGFDDRNAPLALPRGAQ